MLAEGVVLSEVWHKPASKYYDEAPPLDEVGMSEVGGVLGMSEGIIGGTRAFHWRAVHGVVVGLLLVLVVGSVVLWWENPVHRDELSPIVGSLRIDLNTADAATLCVLPGVGPRIAERIIADRERHGVFGRMEDIERVNGIGPKIAKRFGRYARVGLAGAGELGGSVGAVGLGGSAGSTGADELDGSGESIESGE